LGACVEYNAAPNKSTWLIGEDIERRAGHLALRSMSDPKVKANQILMVELTGRIKLNVDQAEMIIVEYIITVGF
jgi:Zn-dependent metalloprotease